MATSDTFYPTGPYDVSGPGRVPIFKRISWGAIFAGVVVALIVQLMLGLLGLAFGAGAVDPYGNGPSATSITIGAGIWLIISTLIALFLGGWTAGWLSGLPRGIGTSLHGIVTWGIATFVLFFILTTAVGAVLSGAFSIVGSGLNLVGRGVGATAAGAAAGVDVNSAKNNLMAFLNLDNTATTDESGTRRRGTVSNEMSRQTSRPALERDTAFVAVIARAISNNKESLDQNDRDELVSVLTTRQNLSRDQAEHQVDSVNQKYIEGRQKFGQMKQQAGETAKEVANVAARGVSQAATWTFVMIALGGIAAALGGYVSRPKSTMTIDESDRPVRPSREV